MIPLHRLPSYLPGQYDSGTLHRARQYADHGWVGEPMVVDLDEHECTVVAEVSGSEAVPYLVQLHLVQLDAIRLEVRSRCTCFVGFQCKHGAALAFVVAGSSDHIHQPEPTWEHGLEQLLGDLGALAPPTHEPVALGLEISLEWPSYGYARDEELCLRPLRRGAKQPWVKGGVTWRELSAARRSGRYAAEQMRALERLENALSAHARYGYQHQSTPLSAFGPDVVPLVRDALDTGIELVPREPFEVVQLLPDALDVEITCAPSPQRDPRRRRCARGSGAVTSSGRATS